MAERFYKPLELAVLNKIQKQGKCLRETLGLDKLTAKDVRLEQGYELAQLIVIAEEFGASYRFILYRLNRSPIGQENGSNSGPHENNLL